jgi:chromatin remodeling complex protein RSC6
MVRATKTSEKQSAKQTIPIKVEVSVAENKVKKTKEPKVKVAAVVVVPEPVVVEDAETKVIQEPKQLTVKVGEFGAKLQQLFGMLSSVKTEFKAIEKSIAKEMKIAEKLLNKKRRNNVNRKPSGFVKPTRISDELAEFLGKEIGTELARTSVSKEINTYIIAHKLQDVKNGRIIHADPKLTKLLNVLPGEELTYFNLQRYMKHHFIKEVKPVVV